jgi:5-methylcytosine-specific restriction endonuclease McrA
MLAPTTARLRTNGDLRADQATPTTTLRSATNSDLPAAEVHARLLAALERLQRAERNAVLWFAEIDRRRLYRDLGYSSIQAYASEKLGFSSGKTYQFIRLARALTELPRLRKAVARGELGWTKAREIAKVATARTEARYIALARRSTSRELEEEVRQIRIGARAAGKRMAQQAGRAALAGGQAFPRDRQLPVGQVPGREQPAEQAADGQAAPAAALALEAPVTITLRFTVEQYARYEALLERIRKRAGRRAAASVQGLDRPELLLAALHDLAQRLDAEPSTRKSAERPGRARSRAGAASSRSPYRVVVYTCSECGGSTIQTGLGARPVPRAVREAIACDCRIQEPGQPNRASVPPKIRQEAMARAGHRCEAPGCGHTRFLEVHHIKPRERGGTNDLANLRVLCSACHRLAHMNGEPLHQEGARQHVGRPDTLLARYRRYL